MPTSPLNAAPPANRNADLFAVGISTLCLLHCLALPLLSVLLPVAGQLSENEAIHRALVIMAVPVSLSAVWQSLRNPAFRLFIVGTLSGLLLLLVAAFSEALSAYEEPLTISGALLLGLAHLWRWRQNDHPTAIHD